MATLARAVCRVERKRTRLQWRHIDAADYASHAFGIKLFFAINDRDRPFVTGALLEQNGLALTAGGWRERVEMLASMGATEIAFQPGGPDIAGELTRFARAVRQ